jgi:hypothetical protein
MAQTSDLLVYLFVIEVPFVLRPVPGTPNHEMINVAHVPGNGDSIPGPERAEDWAGWTSRRQAARGTRLYNDTTTWWALQNLYV